MSDVTVYTPTMASASAVPYVAPSEDYVPTPRPEPEPFHVEVSKECCDGPTWVSVQIPEGSPIDPEAVALGMRVLCTTLVSDPDG